MFTLDDVGSVPLSDGSFKELSLEEKQEMVDEWNINLKKISDYKAEKKSQINEWRAQANQSTFPFAGKLVAVDVLSRSDIDGVASYVSLNNALPPNFPNVWKATDNSYIPIPDVATFKSLVAAMVAQGAFNFAKSQELKAQVDAATTIEQVEAIQW